MCNTTSRQVRRVNPLLPGTARPDGYDYPPEVRFEVAGQDLESDLRAHGFLNLANTGVACRAPGKFQLGTLHPVT
jgi:hypothetical protein